MVTAKRTSVRAHAERLEAWRASLQGDQSLRGLALAIENVARVHPCYSQAYHVVSCCVDHLCAVAGFHEQQHKHLDLCNAARAAIKELHGHSDANLVPQELAARLSKVLNALAPEPPNSQK